MATKKPHVVCLPTPAQGHLTPMMTLARLLHSRGFYITMVLTEFDVARLSTSLAAESPTLQGLHDFTFEILPDGLPPENKRGVLDLPKLACSIQGEPKKVFKGILMRLNYSSDVPPITSIISDGSMFFAHEIGKELGIKVLFLHTTSACGLLGYMLYDDLVKRGLFPLEDESCLTSGFLDTPVDWVPGLIKGTTLKHLPTFLRSTDPNDILFNYMIDAAKTSYIVDGVILNTFDKLEGDVLEEIKSKIPNLYTVGPLSLLRQQVSGQELPPLRMSYWAKDTKCLEWLDKRNPKSVIYVNFGSLAILTPQQLEEFARGLANSKHPFLWVIRPGLVVGDSGITTDDKYLDDVKGRGLITSWCPQEKVLQHPSVALFLTHCGWNSILESMTAGMPMICWSFISEQQTNCHYACQEWGIGVEIEEGYVRREKVEELVREVMEGEKGKEVNKKIQEWKLKAEEATRHGGSSHNNFDKLVKDLM